jgi:hypothetical protein
LFKKILLKTPTLICDYLKTYNNKIQSLLVNCYSLPATPDTSGKLQTGNSSRNTSKSGGVSNKREAINSRIPRTSRTSKSRDSSNIRGLSNTRNASNSRIPVTHGEPTAVETLTTAGVEAFEGKPATADILGTSQQQRR